MCLAIKGQQVRREYMDVQALTDSDNIYEEFILIISKLIADRPIVYELNNIVLDTKEKGVSKTFIKNVSLYYKGLIMLQSIINLGFITGLNDYDKKQLVKEANHNLKTINTALNRKTSKADLIKNWCYFEFYKCDTKDLLNYLLVNLNYNECKRGE